MNQLFSIKSIKQHKISIISVLAFTVALCCIFAFSAGNVTEAPSEAESLETSSAVLLDGEGIYVDGVFVAAVSDLASAESAVASALDARASALGIADSAELSFKNTVEILNGSYAENDFLSADAAAVLLSSGSPVSVRGESLGFRLSVVSSVSVSETVVIEHTTKTIYTDTLSNGVKRVNQRGFDGEGIDTYRVVSVDGVETERVYVGTEVLTAPIEEVVRVGTRSNGMNIASLNRFQKPYDGMVTSYMGPRWGRTHKGIDVAKNGCSGDPVVAAGDGTVVLAEWNGGYGNCVIIDHGDGVQTLYAHFSKIAVKAGDVVSAGAYIGNVGSTGNVTGPHLHFEVYVDGETVNPLIFVDYD